jgi:hypothetical protein
MKANTLSKLVSAGAIAASLAIAPLSLPSHAQVDPNPENPTVDTTPFQESSNDFNNLGWLGLIGLLGIANLFRKPKTVTHYREPEATRTTGYRE